MTTATVQEKQSNVYTIKHICGHVVTKQVLEATPFKQRKAVKCMESMRCYECIVAARQK